jgi:hypothetical protein
MKQMAPAMKKTADWRPSIGKSAAKKPVTKRAEISEQALASYTFISQ